MIWSFLVYEITPHLLQPLAVAWAETAAGAIGLVVPDRHERRVRLFEASWDRFPEALTATVRVGDTTRTLRAIHAPDYPVPPHLWTVPGIDGGTT